MKSFALATLAAVAFAAKKDFTGVSVRDAYAKDIYVPAEDDADNARDMKEYQLIAAGTDTEKYTTLNLQTYYKNNADTGIAEFHGNLTLTTDGLATGDVVTFGFMYSDDPTAADAKYDGLWGQITIDYENFTEVTDAAEEPADEEEAANEEETPETEQPAEEETTTPEETTPVDGEGESAEGEGESAGRRILQAEEESEVKTYENLVDELDLKDLNSSGWADILEADEIPFGQDTVQDVKQYLVDSYVRCDDLEGGLCYLNLHFDRNQVTGDAEDIDTNVARGFEVSGWYHISRPVQDEAPEIRADQNEVYLTLGNAMNLTTAFATLLSAAYFAF